MMVLKNPEGKKLYISLLTAFILSIGIAYLIAFLSVISVKKSLVEYKATVVGIILKDHKELEEEIVRTVTKDNYNDSEGEALKLGKEVLAKYGYDENIKIRNEWTANEVFKESRNLNIIFLVVIFSLIIVIVSIFIKKIYNEIYNIGNYVERVTEGILTERIDGYSLGEIGLLKSNLAKMTTMLNEQIAKEQKQKEFLSTSISDISHQLKTPMTSLIMFNDIMDDPSMNWNIRKDFIENAGIQLKRMDWLIKSLLKLSRLDAGVIEFKKEKVYIKKLIDKTILSLRGMIDKKNQSITISGDEDCFYIGDMDWSIEALVNIFKNCIEHTKDCGNLEVNYEKNPLFTTIKIKDHGEGIKKEDINKIFKRFYKGSSSVKTESIGIGLALTKTIIEKQNGSITVESEINKGTEFTISLYNKCD